MRNAVRNTKGHDLLRAHLAALRRDGKTQTDFASALSEQTNRHIGQGSISRWVHCAMPAADVIVALTLMGVANPRDWLIPSELGSGPLPIDTPTDGTGTDDD